MSTRKPGQGKRGPLPKPPSELSFKRSVSLSPEVHEYLVWLGDQSLSRGIAIAADDSLKARLGKSFGANKPAND